ncbi:MAG: nicotinate phosphoribosyltransferase, partial [Lentisphaeraceae bacterium]|nr:nicotinate phosphoribosyltransferase [Lentisphaeraceae bacterium]
PNGDKLFEEGFIQYLRKLKLKVDVEAMPEGTVTFPRTPLIRVKGNLIACQLLETALLNCVNFDSLVATKAARIKIAAKSSEVFEFGLRRAQGAEAGLRASRSAWIGGTSATSNVLAASKYGIPLKGSHGSSWVMAHSDELDAFINFGLIFPGACVLLVDTYSTIDGIKNAVKAAEKLASQNIKLEAICLDSGNMLELSCEARSILDEAGLKSTKIIAAGSLDEHVIEDLKSKGARINIFGVGTRLVTAFDDPALACVYKLSAIRESSEDAWQYKVKVSDDVTRTSFPGVQQVKRFSRLGFFDYDVIINEDGPQGTMAVNLKTGASNEPFGKSELMLKPLFRNGKFVGEKRSLQEIRDYCQEQLSQLKKDYTVNLFSEAFKVGIDEELYALKLKLKEEQRSTK